MTRTRPFRTDAADRMRILNVYF